MNLVEYVKYYSSVKHKLHKAERDTERNPSEAKVRAENYRKGKFYIDGLKISIENPAGSIRQGKDSKGKPWKIKMKNSYGYINGVKSVDGDNIDVFLSKDPSKGKIYIVDQKVPGTQKFDEHKIMYGFDTKDQAVKAYKSNYSKDWKGLGKVTEFTRDKFKEFIKNKKQVRKPISAYKNLQTK